MNGTDPTAVLHLFQTAAGASHPIRSDTIYRSLIGEECSAAWELLLFRLSLVENDAQSTRRRAAVAAPVCSARRARRRRREAREFATASRRPSDLQFRFFISIKKKRVEFVAKFFKLLQKHWKNMQGKVHYLPQMLTNPKSAMVSCKKRKLWSEISRIDFCRPAAGSKIVYLDRPGNLVKFFRPYPARRRQKRTIFYSFFEKLKYYTDLSATTIAVHMLYS